MSRVSMTSVGDAGRGIDEQLAVMGYRFTDNPAGSFATWSFSSDTHTWSLSSPVSADEDR